MRRELRAACGTGKCTLYPVSFVVVNFGVELQSLGSCKGLIALAALIVAIETNVNSKISQLWKVFKALIATVHPCRSGRRVFISELKVREINTTLEIS